MTFMGGLPARTVERDRKLAEQIARSRTPKREALGRLAGDEKLWCEKRTLCVHVVPAKDAMGIQPTRRVLKREVVRYQVGAHGSFA